MRAVIDAIFYVDRTGCQWRALPHDFPPWSTVWSYFRIWRNDGTWERIHTALREQVRVKQGREPTPSAAIATRTQNNYPDLVFKTIISLNTKLAEAPASVARYIAKH